MKKRDSRLVVPFPKWKDDGWAAVESDPFMNFLFLGRAFGMPMLALPEEGSFEIVIGIVEGLEVEDPEHEQDIPIVGHIQHLNRTLLPIREKGIVLTFRSFHGHMCDNPSCFTYWSHHVKNEHAEGEYDELHKCPKCGTLQFLVYQGPWAIPEKP